MIALVQTHFCLASDRSRWSVYSNIDNRQVGEAIYVTGALGCDDDYRWDRRYRHSLPQSALTTYGKLQDRF